MYLISASIGQSSAFRKGGKSACQKKKRVKTKFWREAKKNSAKPNERQRREETTTSACLDRCARVVSRVPGSAMRALFRSLVSFNSNANINFKFNSSSSSNKKA